MPRPKWTDRLVLRAKGPASPARVERAARMLASAVYAADYDLPEGEITLVVRNFEMTAELRALTPRADKVIEHIDVLISNPMKAVEARPSSALIADALAEHARDLEADSAAFYRKNRKKPRAMINEQFAEHMRVAAKAGRSRSAVISGPTSTYGPVLRVGRTRETTTYVSARLKLGSKFHDIRIASNDEVPRFFEAAMSGRTVKTLLDAQWLQDETGAYRIDPRNTKALRIDPEWSEITGAEFVAQATLKVPSIAEHFEEILAELEGDQT